MLDVIKIGLTSPHHHNLIEFSAPLDIASFDFSIKRQKNGEKNHVDPRHVRNGDVNTDNSKKNCCTLSLLFLLLYDKTSTHMLPSNLNQHFINSEKNC